MTNTMNTTNAKANEMIHAVENEKRDTSKAEICFGALMAIAALAGMWGAVSLMITYFIG